MARPTSQNVLANGEQLHEQGSVTISAGWKELDQVGFTEQTSRLVGDRESNAV